MKPLLKKLLIAGLVILLAGAGVIWYFFSLKFNDTSKEKAAYAVTAADLLSEFGKNDTLANKKYTDKIITVKGIVSETEQADSTVNIKFSDSASGAYIIFAFQQQHLAEAKTLKEGDTVVIKGSCSGGTYSDILETVFISFQRCAIDK
jgi:hypothetical protein